MNISNQNNGRMGQTLHHEYAGTNGAVAVLERILAHVLSHGGTDEHLLCDYFQTKTWELAQRSDIVTAFRGAEKLSNYRR